MKCPACGAELRYDPELKKNICDYCDSTYDLEDLKEKKAKEKLAEEDFFETILYMCPQCGANLYTTEETYVTFCSYCGSSNTLEGKMVKSQKPKKIIPFALTKEEAERAYRGKLRKALFVPGNMAKDEVIEKFRGIYMPYWNYDMDYTGEVNIKGTTSKQKGDYKYVRHYDLPVGLDMHYHGVAFDASSAFSDNLSGGMAPFDAKEAKAFEPAYINGFYADMPDLGQEIYKEEAKAVAGRDSASRIQRLLPVKRYHIEEKDCDQGSKLKTHGTMAMYPVWFLSSKSKDGKRISYAAVNGQTGRVAAELPMDFKKYLLVSLVLAVPIFLLLNLFFVLTPMKALGIAFVLNFIGALMIDRECNLAYARKHRLQDKGYYAKHINDADFREKVMPDEDKKSESKTSGKKTSGKKTSGKKASDKKVSSKTAGGKKASDQKSDVQQAKQEKPVTTVQMVLSIASSVWLLIVVVLVVASFFNLEAVLNLIFSRGGYVLLIVILLSYMCHKFSKAGKAKAGLFSKKEVYYMPIEEKWKPLIKALIGLAISGIVFAINPTEDLIHYIAAVVSMAFVVWNFYDLILVHNAISSRPIPQMEKRGGDEN